MSNNKTISIKGAREHNLKNISVEIPKNSLTVITGVSGSGKSTLAFDTIYAEGQRRYVESLSSYARQFLDLQDKPDVDFIEGLSPAISIEQKTTSRNPRSTVGTITEIYDYLRLLWARIGVPHSPVTGLPIAMQSVSDMVDRTMKEKQDSKILIMSPLARQKKGEFKKEVAELKRQGFVRLEVDGTTYEIDEFPSLDKNKKHDIYIVVDRIIMKPEIEKRLADSFETAIKISGGIAYVKNLDTQEGILFSNKFACPVSGFTLEEVEPRLFSFNAPIGACPHCSGLGIKYEFSEDLIIPDRTLSIRNGAIAPWSRNGMITQYEHVLTALSKAYKIPLNTPWRNLSKEHQTIILFGNGEQEITIDWNGWVTHKPYEGVVGNLDRLFKETESQFRLHEISQYQREVECPVCHGNRLNEKALCVKINGMDIITANQYQIGDALNIFENLHKHLTPQQNKIAEKILKEIIERLGFLKNVGIGYLTLSRLAGSLSGGESQRIRLASQIGSGLTGIIYVLDEPSIGLHQQDNDKLINTLQTLKKKDNTVIVVEHDEDTMNASDYVIDMGPFAGIHGGQIVAQGTVNEIKKNPDSLTGQFLSGKLTIPVPKKLRQGNGKFLSLFGASQNNLKTIDVSIPLNTLTCVTGVSGSGKSTLVLETLCKAIEKNFSDGFVETGKYKSIEGLENIDKLIEIDQSPIGRTPRSNPATYTGIFTPIREWFSGLPEAKARGYTSGRFSFNVKGGRCEHCQGDGVLKIEMHFLPDVYVECDKCKGKRYNRETLEVKYKDKSIADVLDMSIDEACIFFENIPSIAPKLKYLQEVGLGYIKLGQSATTLSGGEAQRVKLSKELSKRSTGKTLYVLDEPTTGLHFYDVKKLLEVLHRLVDAGNSMIIIEHNLDVIKTADYVIDLGPEGGDKGGQIIAEGTPLDIANSPNSATGKFLKKLLK